MKGYISQTFMHIVIGIFDLSKLAVSDMLFFFFLFFFFFFFVRGLLKNNVEFCSQKLPGIRIA